MDTLDYYIKYNLHIGHTIELIAALAGSYYILKHKNIPKRFKYFAWYLWFVLIADIFGIYAVWNYFDNYQTFPWLKNSPFAKNEWYFNCLTVIKYIVYSSLFIVSLATSKIKRVLKWAILVYLIIGIVEILFIGNVFTEYIITNIFLGTLLLLICVGAYFQKLAQSDDIINFSRDLTFYIAIGAVIWNLCVTPIYIYNSYFNTKNEEFILLFAAILRYSNIFMYGIFSFGFIYCAQEKQLPGLNKKRGINKREI